MSNLLVEELAIHGAWTLTPKQFRDDRGTFLEWLRQDVLADAIGHSLDLQQANVSVSAAGVVRGIHFAAVPPSQAKYVTCVSGAVFDVVVDIRVGSPTFGQWAAVLLDDEERRSVYVAEGLGHGFISLEDGSTVVYLCSAPYTPDREHGIHPLDPAIGIEWPAHDRNGAPLVPRLSDKDAAAPSLAEASDSGVLPDYGETLAYYHTLRGR